MAAPAKISARSRRDPDPAAMDARRAVASTRPLPRGRRPTPRRGRDLVRDAVIGLILPDIADPLYSQAIQGAESAAARRRCFVAAASSDDDFQKESRLAAMMFAADVDGILFLGRRSELERTFLESSLRCGKPILFLDHLDHDDAALGVELLLERIARPSSC